MNEIIMPWLDLQLFADGDIGVNPDPADPDEDIDDDEGLNVPDDDDDFDTDGDEDDDDDTGGDDDSEVEKKVKQDPRINKAMAELRRRAEAAERKAQAAEQKAQQFESQTRQQADQQQADKFQEVEKQILQAKAALDPYKEQVKAQYINQNYDPALAEVYAEMAVMKRKETIRDAEMTLNNEKARAQAAEAQRNAQVEQFQARIFADHAALKAKFGDIVPEIADMGDTVASRVIAGESLKAVWIDENFDKVAELKAKSAAKQARTQADSKKHLGVEKSGTASIDTTAIPPEIFKAYKQMNPKWTDAEIAKDYRKHNKKRK